jgi:hypothetical protein
MNRTDNTVALPLNTLPSPQGQYRHIESDFAGIPKTCSSCAEWTKAGDDVAEKCRSIQSQCALCAAGKHRVASSCDACPRGQYQPDIGSENCLKCPSGQFQKERGKTFCEAVKPGYSLAMVPSEDGSSTMVQESLQCPSTGVECKGAEIAYTGNVWHDPQIEVPNCTAAVRCTRGAVCDIGAAVVRVHQDLIRSSSRDALTTHSPRSTLAGCPSQGASKMECKQGYRGPLCAVCNDGYFQSIKDCVRCEKPKVDVMVALVAIVLALLCTCLHFVSQYRRYLARVNAFARKSSLQNAHRTSRSNHLRLHSSDLKVLVSFVTFALTLNTQLPSST